MTARWWERSTCADADGSASVTITKRASVSKVFMRHSPFKAIRLLGVLIGIILQRAGPTALAPEAIMI
jgi:hypothetical protein